MRDLAAVALALVLWPGLGAAQESAGKITHSFPPAYVIQPPQTKIDAEANTPFRTNDVLRTEQDGRLRAQLNDGSILHLGSKTALKIIQHDGRAQQSSFQLQYGKMRAQVIRRLNPESRFEVRTNLALSSVLEQADFVVNASNPVATVVIAFSGTVVVRNDAGSVRLTSGQATTVGPSAPPSPPQQATPEQMNGSVAAAPAPALGGGVGGGVFRVGGGVSAPQLISRVEPEYSEAGLKDKCEGIVVLYAVVDVDGTVRDLRVFRGLGCGLDEKALEAVRQWKFSPGMKGGQPVAVAASIEVRFVLPHK